MKKALVITLAVSIFLLLGVGSYFMVAPQLISETRCTGTVESSVKLLKATTGNLAGEDIVRVSYSTLPNSECMYIKVTENELKEELQGENFEVKEPILGSIELIEMQREYNIKEKSGGNTYYHFVENKVNVGLFEFCSPSKCAREGFDVIQSTYYNDDCLCITEESTGIAGEPQSSSGINWKTKVTIGESSVILSPGDATKEIGSIAKVKWAGNVGSNDNLQSLGKEFYKAYTSNKYVLIDKTFEVVKSDFLDIRYELQECGALKNCNNEVVRMRGYNSVLEGLKSDKTNNWVNSEFYVGNAKIESNKFIVDLENAIAYPSFVLDIKASEVGIFESQGEPKVTCPKDFDLISGKTEGVTANIENIGDFDSFEFYVTCDKGSWDFSPSSPTNINKNNDRDITLYMGLTTEDEDTANCNFVAKSIGGQITDTCRFFRFIPFITY